MTTIRDAILAGAPNASDDLIEHILWGRTPYPCGRVDAKGFYKAASGYRRASEHGIDLCDFCHRQAVKNHLCARCDDALRPATLLTISR